MRVSVMPSVGVPARPASWSCVPLSVRASVYGPLRRMARRVVVWKVMLTDAFQPVCPATVVTQPPAANCAAVQENTVLAGS